MPRPSFRLDDIKTEAIGTPEIAGCAVHRPGTQHEVDATFFQCIPGMPPWLGYTLDGAAIVAAITIARKLRCAEHWHYDGCGCDDYCDGFGTCNGDCGCDYYDDGRKTD